jgi:hypothetical protein
MKSSNKEDVSTSSAVTVYKVLFLNRKSGNTLTEPATVNALKALEELVGRKPQPVGAAVVSEVAESFRSKRAAKKAVLAEEESQPVRRSSRVQLRAK